MMAELPRIFFYLGCLSIAQIKFRPFFSLTLSDWFFFIALIITIVNISINQSLLKMVLPLKMRIGIYLFFLNVLLSLFFINGEDTIFITIKTTLKVGYIWTIWFWLAAIILESDAHIKKAVFCFGISCAVSAYYGILEVPKYYWIRPMGLAEHVNQFGATSAIGIAYIFPFLSENFFKNIRKNIYTLLLPICIFILCTYGLFLSKSLGSISAVFISLVFWAVIKKKKVKKVTIVFIISISMFPLLSYQAKYSNSSILHRFQAQTDLSNNKATLTSRLITYQAALPLIIRNPIIGEGSATSIKTTGSHVHNTFLMVLFEFGLFSMIGLALIFISSFKILFLTIKNADTKIEKQLSLSLFLGFLVYFIICLKEPILYNRFGWLAVALALPIRYKQIQQNR